MWELLQKIEQRGWKPYGKSIAELTETEKNIRLLTSRSSGLWQFVCEMSVYNNYNKEKGKVFTWKKFEDDKYQINGYSNGGGYIQDYEYRIIESSLKDESELEQFLLDNIKIGQ